MLIHITQNKTIEAADNYTANDVLSENKTNAAGTAWTFTHPLLGKGKGIYLTGADITFSKSGGITAITPRTSLLLFTTTPTSELDDNSANTAPSYADRTFYIGRVNFEALSNIGGSPDAKATPSTYGGLPKPFILTEGNFYGILAILDAETNETGYTVVTIDLYGEVEKAG